MSKCEVLDERSFFCLRENFAQRCFLDSLMLFSCCFHPDLFFNNLSYELQRNLLEMSFRIEHKNFPIALEASRREVVRVNSLGSRTEALVGAKRLT